MPAEEEAKTGAGATDKAAPQKKSNLKLIIIIAVAVLLVGGGAAYFFLIRGHGEPPSAETAEPAKKEGKEGEKKSEGEKKGEGKKKAEGEKKGEGEKKAEGEKKGEGEKKAEGETTTGETKTETPDGNIFPLEHFIVNVNDDSQTDARYLKIEIKLELSTTEMQTEIENKVPKIRDSIVTILTNKSVADINNTNGKMRLKEEIRARINSFMTTGKINDVYFTDFIIQ